MKFYSYVVRRDYGFAPNPFHGVCTLATCKSSIRKHAEVGDWIIGCGSKELGLQGKIVYAMQVSETLSFTQYWEDPKFVSKRPVMNGSLQMMYGDNIYMRQGVTWLQADSHHSLEGGLVNEKNLLSDTRADRVLIGENFYYFGGDAIEVQKSWQEEIVYRHIGQKHIKNKQAALDFIEFLSTHYEKGINGFPAQFSTFERYGGD